MDDAAPDLRALARAVVSELDAVSEEEVGSVISIRRGATEIARAHRRWLEVRLPEDIAEAATRTPDATAVEGQPGWVRLQPASDEPLVSDRATAWIRTAWRHAGTA